VASRTSRPKVPTWPPPSQDQAAGARAALPSDPTELATALDQGFDAVRAPSDQPPAEGAAPALSSDAAYESFDSIAVVHLRPVRELVMEMRLGDAPTAWLAICTPAVQTVRRFAAQIGREALLPRLDALLEALSAAQANGARIEGQAKEALEAGYAGLVEALPGVEAVEGEVDRREHLIARALLMQVDGLHRLMLERLSSAGLHGLATLLHASADELVQATAIPAPVASRIVDRFARYRSESASLAGSADRRGELSRLQPVLETLRRLHADHERAAQAWSVEAIADKRRLRSERRRALLQIEVVLARLGELARIASLERLAHDRKIAELDSYLHRAAAEAAQGSGSSGPQAIQN
jgi:hypothetical protein